MEALGGEIIENNESFGEENLLVMPNNTEFVPYSLKALISYSKSIVVVCEGWIHSSVSAGAFVEMYDYIINDLSFEEDCLPLQQTLLNSKKAISKGGFYPGRKFSFPQE